MLTRPDLDERAIVACLEREYGLSSVRIDYLPLGADVNTAVYRATSSDGTAYFCKLRRGTWDEVAVTLPRYLSEQGVRQIIPPLPGKTGRPWVEMEAFRVILYPYVPGQDGYEVPLSERQWRDLGAALARVHAVELPASLAAGIPRETYSPRWRGEVRAFLERVDREAFQEPVAAQLASLLRKRRGEILHLARRAGTLAAELEARPLDTVVCHADLHAGNVHLAASGDLYLVDWDNPVLACKERDLMSVGGGLFGDWYAPEEEERLFYQGYGPAAIDWAALAYYRYERIVQDLAAFCEQIFASDEGGEDREQSLHYVRANFRPGGTIAQAHRADSLTAAGPSLG